MVRSVPLRRLAQSGGTMDKGPSCTFGPRSACSCSALLAFVSGIPSPRLSHSSPRGSFCVVSLCRQGSTGGGVGRGGWACRGQPGPKHVDYRARFGAPVRRMQTPAFLYGFELLASRVLYGDEIRGSLCIFLGMGWWLFARRPRKLCPCEGLVVSLQHCGISCRNATQSVHSALVFTALLFHIPIHSGL